jgi:predicted transcriptional regulator
MMDAALVQPALVRDARGEYKPAPDEPKVWFTSMESLAQVLSSKNALLLELIRCAQPASIKELAERRDGN